MNAPDSILSPEQHRKAHLAFRRSVGLAETQKAFGLMVGTTQQNVSELLRKGRLLPMRYVEKAEAGTGVSRHELRPDLYPPEEDGNSVGRTRAGLDPRPADGGDAPAAALPKRPAKAQEPAGRGVETGMGEPVR